MSLRKGGSVLSEKRQKGIVVEFAPERISKIMPILSARGHSFIHIPSIENFIEIIQNIKPKIAILASSIAISSKSKSENIFKTDLDIAKLINQKHPDCKILFVINSKIDIDICIQAINTGICGFVSIDEPEFEDILDEHIKQIIARRQTNIIDSRTEINPQELTDSTGIATQSATMLELLSKARKAARIGDVPIIIEGESGTGKQLLAEAIHKMDPQRKIGPFLSINCASITGTLAESALFGHKKGAFTGATEDRLGYFRSANGGTLLLDEISELEPALQPKLLRALQENKVMPVGDDKEYHINVRIIAASNKPLAQEVAENRFRLDLYQRLNVIKLKIPPLRQRVEDIPLLVHYFIKKYRHYTNQEITKVDPAVYAILKRAVGKGNVRELENIIRQTLVFKTSGKILSVSDLPEHVISQASQQSEPTFTMPTELKNYLIKQLSSNKQLSLSEIIKGFEASVLETAINDLELRGTKLAQKLNLNRRTLYNKLKKYRLLDNS